MAIVDLEHISKSFLIPSVHRQTVREHVLDLFRARAGETLQVLDGVSLSIKRGETLGIMGRNGSGKTTLLKILAGIYQPDRGRVHVRAPLTAILALGVGWNPELDAIDNTYLIGSVMGLSLAELRSCMDEILAFAELERFARLKLQHYSSGMAARLAYAIAFRAVREILVLDEIFAVGDAAFRAKCEARYRQLHAAGHTIIMVSHDPVTINAFCNRAVLLEQGRPMAEGPPQQVTHAYAMLLGGAVVPERAALTA